MTLLQIENSICHLSLYTMSVTSCAYKSITKLSSIHAAQEIYRKNMLQYAVVDDCIFRECKEEMN